MFLLKGFVICLDYKFYKRFLKEVSRQRVCNNIVDVGFDSFGKKVYLKVCLDF